jgi:uncharacterized membrane protein
MSHDEPPVPQSSGQRYEQRFDAAMSPMSGKLDAEHTAVSVREFWEKSWPLLIPYLLITFLSPVLGLWLTGAIGVAVGEALAIVNLIVGFYAVTRLRVTETRHKMHKG